MVKYIVFLFPLNGDYGTDSEEPFTGAVLLLPPWIPAAAGPAEGASY